MRDQEGALAVMASVDALPGEPYPQWPLGFHKGIHHRLHVGPYRVIYYMDGDVISIRRVDKVL